MRTKTEIPLSVFAKLNGLSPQMARYRARNGEIVTPEGQSAIRKVQGHSPGTPDEWVVKEGAIILARKRVEKKQSFAFHFKVFDERINRFDDWSGYFDDLQAARQWHRTEGIQWERKGYRLKLFAGRKAA